MNCKQPLLDLHGQTTTIPMPKCVDYFFKSEEYIKHENSIINGKINFWRIESLKLLREANVEGGRKLSATCHQEEWALEKGAWIQECIANFKHCAISLLDIVGIKKVVLRVKQFECQEEAELISRMVRHDFQLVVDPGEGPDDFELITRFDRLYRIEFSFGKPEEDKLEMVDFNVSKRVRNHY